MSTCVNRNSPEFKAILETQPNIFLAEVLFRKMYNENALEDAIQEFTESSNKETSIKGIDKMAQKLGIEYSIISKDTAFEMIGDSNQAGFYKAGHVYLVDGLFTPETAFHEFSHPVIKALSKDNPEVFQSIYDQVVFSTENGKLIVQRVKDLNPTLDEQSDAFKEEVITTALGQVYTGNVTLPNNVLNNIWFAIKQFLRRIFGKKINISKLDGATSLKDLFKMIHSGEEFVLDMDFLQSDEMIMFQKLYEAEVEAISNNSDMLNSVDNITNTLYEVVKTQLATLKHESDIYQNIKEGLVDPVYNNGLLQELNKLLTEISSKSNQANIPIDSQRQLDLIDPSNYTPNTLDEYQHQLDIFENKIRSFVAGVHMITPIVENFTKGIATLEKLFIDNRKFTPKDFDTLMAYNTYVNAWNDVLNAVMNTTAYFEETQDLHQLVVNTYSKVSVLKDRVQKLKTDTVIDELHALIIKDNEDAINMLEGELKKLENNKNSIVYRNKFRDLHGMFPEEFNEFSELRRRFIQDDKSLTQEELNRKDVLSMYAAEAKILTKTSLRDILEGRTRDVSQLDNMIFAYMNQKDTVSRSLGALFNDVHLELSAIYNQYENKMLDGLEYLMEDAGFGGVISGTGKMGEALSTTSLKSTVNAKGEIEQFEVYQFISNFKDWEFEYNVLQHKLKQLTDRHNTATRTQTPAELEDLALEIVLAQEKIKQFKRDYMHQDGLPTCYAFDYLLETPIGRIANEKRQKIFAQINLLSVHNKTTVLDSTTMQEIKDLWFQYKELQNPYNTDGTLKTGQDKEIADVLFTYSNYTNQFYEWTPIPNKYESAFNDFQEDLNTHIASFTVNGQAPTKEQIDEERKKQTDKWVANNTTISYTQEYFDYRSALSQERSMLIAPLLSVNESIKDISPLYDELFQLIKNVTDSSGVYEATRLTTAAQKRLVELHIEIDEAKENFVKLSGLTPAEQNELNNITIQRDSRPNKDFPNDTIKQRFFDLYAKAKDGLKRFGISEQDVQRIKDIDSVLMSLTTPVATDYYIGTFQNFIDTNIDFHDILQKFFNQHTDRFGSIDLSSGDKISNEHFNLLLFDLSLIAELQSVDQKFSEWFRNNHYYSEAPLFSVDGQFIEMSECLKKTAAWTHNTANDISSYKQYQLTDKNGNQIGPLLDSNGTPRIPNISYQQRDYKEEYKTPIILRDTVDADDNLILATKNNSGEWLPREDVATDKQQFINPEYKSMFNKNRPLFDLLQHVKNNFLDVQKNNSLSQKLYLDYPRIRISGAEAFSKGFWKRKATNFMEFFMNRDREDEYESGTARLRRPSDQYSQVTRPVSGMYNIEKLHVSRDIIATSGRYAYSLQAFNQMRKISSFTQSIHDMIAEKSTSLSKFKQVLSFLRLTATNANNYQRLKSVSNLLDSHLHGEQISQDDSLSKLPLLNRTMDLLRRNQVWKFFAYNVPSALKNYFGGKLMIRAMASGGLFSHLDFTIGQARATALSTELIRDSYSNSQLSLGMQFIVATGMIPDRTKKNAGLKGSKKLTDSLIRFKNATVFRRFTSEKIAMDIFMTLNQTRKFRDLNGKMTTLYDSIEKDSNGLIQTNDATPEEWRIGVNTDGEVELGSSVKKLINTQKGVLMESLGVGDEMAKTNSEKYMLGKGIFFIMKFFLPMYQARWKGISGFATGRPQTQVSAYTGQAQFGTFVQTINLILKSPYMNSNFINRRDMRGFYQVSSFFLLDQILKMAMSMITFNDDDNELTKYNYNPEEEDNIKRLKYVSGLPEWIPFVGQGPAQNLKFNADDYFKSHLLKTMQSVRSETEIWYPIGFNSKGIDFKGGTIGGLVDMATMQGPGFAGTAKPWMDILQEIGNGLINGELSTYGEDSGVFEHQQKGAKKLPNLLLKQIGFSGHVIDPMEKIEIDEKATLNRR